MKEIVNKFAHEQLRNTGDNPELTSIDFRKASFI